jgi:hypothetical protein
MQPLTHLRDFASRPKPSPIAELEMKYGFRSSFNFIPEGPYSVPPALRSWLADRGFEVGVHDLQHDGNLYSSREEFRRKAQRINFHLKEWNAAGFRSGFMLHNLDWIGDLEIQYDSSTFDTDPFEPQPDGMNTIFPFWVPRSSAAGSINHQPSTLNHPGGGYIELPYTLPQDSTLFLLLGETTSRIWKAKLNWIAKHGGMVLLNTHPDYMRFYQHGGLHEFPARLYEDFLKYLRTRYAGEHWHALPREVATFAFQYEHSQPKGNSEKQLLLLRSPSISPSLSRTKSNLQDRPEALGAIFDHDIYQISMQSFPV